MSSLSLSPTNSTSRYLQKWASGGHVFFTSPFSNSSIEVPVDSPMVGCEHLHLYLSGSGRASQESAISDCYEKALLGINNSV